MGVINLSIKLRNAMLQTLADEGPHTLEIYGGWIPRDAEQELHPDHVLFGTLEFSTPAADPPVDGVLTFRSITAAPACLANGIAAWGRVKNSQDEVLLDGDVRQDGTGLINFSKTDFVPGGPIILNAFILQIPANIYF